MLLNEKAWSENNTLKEYSKSQIHQGKVNQNFKNLFSKKYGVSFRTGATTHHFHLVNSPNYGDPQNICIIDAGSVRDSECIHRLIQIMHDNNIKTFEELKEYLDNVEIWGVNQNDQSITYDIFQAASLTQ